MTRLKHLIMAALVLAYMTGCTEVVSTGGQDDIAVDDLDSDIGMVDDFAMDYEPDSVDYFNNVITNTVYFEVNQSTLTPEGESALVAQADWLSDYPEYDITVEGHADERGTREYNLGLGARRAEAVRNFLITQNVDDARIGTVSYGKERPFSACSDESCWSLNRRSVTLLSGGKIS